MLRRPGHASSNSAKARTPVSIRCRCSHRLLPVYIDVLRELADGGRRMGADRRAMSRARPSTIVAQQALHYAYSEIAKAVPQLKIMLATYFGGLGGNRDTALALPVAGLHLDLVRAPDQIDTAVARFSVGDRVLSLGIIGGRNIWRADLSRDTRPARTRDHRNFGKGRVQIAPSCSLLHVPIDLALETGLDPEIKSWLAFSVQKLEELTTLGTGARRVAAGRRRSRRTRCLGRGGRRTQGLAANSRCERWRARIAGLDDGDAPPRQRIHRSSPAFSTNVSTCRPSRPRPSARFRRRPKSGKRAPRTCPGHPDG